MPYHSKNATNTISKITIEIKFVTDLMNFAREVAPLREADDAEYLVAAFFYDNYPEKTPTKIQIIQDEKTSEKEKEEAHEQLLLIQKEVRKYFNELFNTLYQALKNGVASDPELSNKSFHELKIILLKNFQICVSEDFPKLIGDLKETAELQQSSFKKKDILKAIHEITNTAKSDHSAALKFNEIIFEDDEDCEIEKYTSSMLIRAEQLKSLMKIIFKLHIKALSTLYEKYIPNNLTSQITQNAYLDAIDALSTHQMGCAINLLTEAEKKIITAQVNFEVVKERISRYSLSSLLFSQHSMKTKISDTLDQADSIPLPQLSKDDQEIFEDVAEIFDRIYPRKPLFQSIYSAYRFNDNTLKKLKKEFNELFEKLVDIPQIDRKHLISQIREKDNEIQKIKATLKCIKQKLKNAGDKVAMLLNVLSQNYPREQLIKFIAGEPLELNHFSDVQTVFKVLLIESDIFREKIMNMDKKGEMYSTIVSNTALTLSNP